MSSISAQGVVERASAELTKRINGLGLRASKHHGGGKASVMERVTNVFCGSGGVAYTNLQSASNANATPEKPSRSVPATTTAAMGNMPNVNNKNLNSAAGGGTPSRGRISRNRSKNVPLASGGTGGYVAPVTWDQLMQDDHFLGKFFLYFNAIERRILAQVCSRWRDILYARPRLWAGLVPVVRCRELRGMPPSSRTRLYASLVRRGFRSLVLVSAADEDIPELTHGFPLAQRNVHSLSLRSCAITDKGLEALLDHLQALFELELAGCNEITEAGLWTCLTPRIVSLSLSDCINVADEAVGAVAQLLPSLYEFSLQAYHVTDAALSYFNSKPSSALSILRLQSCWELTNNGVYNIVHYLPHLTVLSLSGCSKVTDDGVEFIAENLPRLRSLDLSWCSRITDTALDYIACDLNQLEELTLDRCVNITDIGVGYICTMGSLSALFLRWCSQLRDLGLQNLCVMKSLQVLSVAGCPLLTSSGLSSLIQLRHLHELELTNCPGTSQELFDYLREHLPRCLIIE
ncbi:PREDICTED: F-box/LRR-repeat protein 16 [Dufourea novaeangliae]|uniref:F-box/LRR-repeat protein 16 n=1 Tax=Dufourea novaeangliae TaxID=178035 RepID=A0A154PAM3_DUFNO|nr:PREDICTED: F-box/LRR-repeat protein 16 [Dufourea novaeangliae]XP_015429883.1 PREDICTED: F-box/LRR-repeat protein 16 [Dufourea novaeangliae]XP_015429884.1 PREDICTED: F-box/LRR-repeat protein 16 [Dufourea novaeangliae]KZC08240.1 F-box/LRR-repeat protein 16 [Dufourea novaeangliae]